MYTQQVEGRGGAITVAQNAEGPGSVVTVVLPGQVARAARQAIWAVRKGGTFRDEAARVIEKHASRKDAGGHFVNDRAPRRKSRPGKDNRQMGFEF